MSEAVKLRAEPRFVFRRVDEIRPKGFAEAVIIFELRGEREASEVSFCQRWDTVYASIRGEQPAAALREISNFLTEYPGDEVAQYHVECCGLSRNSSGRSTCLDIEIMVGSRPRPQMIDRRRLLNHAAGIALGAAGFAAPAIAQKRAKLRLGYLHVVAVDGQIMTGIDRGSFDKQGIDFDLIEFNTGLDVVQAMAAGRLDVLSSGAVISSLLPLGGYTAFLVNDVEIATAQLWVRPDKGVKTFDDLRGKRIATTTKTTAHIFLDRALRANSLGSADVEILNSSMSAAVDAFIAGEVPAVALWVPFNIAVREKLPQAIKLVDASAFYPQSAVVGGWVARQDYYDANKDVFARVIRGWADANDYMVRNAKAAGEALQKNHYPNATMVDITEALKAQRMFSSREWKRLYADGTVTKWLQQVSDFFLAEAAVAGARPATEYFDPSLYLATI
ncbi:NitT/TauT family transport system substrate-binding protein [Bradyrhizobium sp. USDA 4509]